MPEKCLSVIVKKNEEDDRENEEMTEIYYVEDDENIAAVVKEYLNRKGYSVSLFGTLESAAKAFENRVPGMALIDWNMPDGRGDDFCRRVRAKWPELPIIFLTVRNDARDIVSGFENGADDYVTKPFELEVLHSRIKALLRRAGNIQGNCLSCGSIAVDTEKMAVFYDGKEIVVSQAEYRLLLILLQNKGKTVTRERLLARIWDSNGNYVNDNTLTVTMKRLREKLHHPSCIKTIRSFGYRMEDEL